MKKKLPGWLASIEHFIDRSIPYMLALLAVLIILELTNTLEQYHDIIVRIDYTIISFFVIDLGFKWYHTRSALKFLKLYWIDIIAVFPFYTFFRFYTAASEFFRGTEQAQKFLHEAVLLRETKLLRQPEFAARLAKEGRFVRIIPRTLRLFRARWYVTHWHLLKHSNAFNKYHKRK